jgi:hypothetical protein
MYKRRRVKALESPWKGKKKLLCKRRKVKAKPPRSLMS